MTTLERIKHKQAENRRVKLQQKRQRNCLGCVDMEAGKCNLFDKEIDFIVEKCYYKQREYKGAIWLGTREEKYAGRLRTWTEA